MATARKDKKYTELVMLGRMIPAPARRTMVIKSPNTLKMVTVRRLRGLDGVGDTAGLVLDSPSVVLGMEAVNILSQGTKTRVLTNNINTSGPMRRAACRGSIRLYLSFKYLI